MHPERPPWYDRLFDDFPTLPRWAFPVFLLVMVPLMAFLLGMVIGATYDVNKAATRAETVIQDSALRLKLEALDKRLQALEKR